MKYVLLISLWMVAAVVGAQTPVRPYNQWEATQFISVSIRQPEDYVKVDNNWEILYELRTPQSKAELREKGVKCSDSQWLLLEVGGLIKRENDKWKTAIPILDREQTASLRVLSKEIARSMYAHTKSDFVSLAQEIERMGFAGNKLSLVFSYLLDGRMWTKLVLFDEINNHAGWCGCYWVLYEPRTDLACGTNTFGKQDMILTYIDSRIGLSDRVMDRCSEELDRYGKIIDPELIAKLKVAGLVNDRGEALFPIIGQVQDEFHQITERLVDAISKELKDNCGSLAERYGIGNEKEAMVILYHEVMWELISRLIEDDVISIPAIFKDQQSNKDRLNEVVFFVKGGLMQ